VLLILINAIGSVYAKEKSLLLTREMVFLAKISYVLKGYSAYAKMISANLNTP
jgi:hypothetical protein